MSLEKIFSICQYLLYNYPNAIPTLNYLSNRINPDNSSFQFGYFPNFDNISTLLSHIDQQTLINHKLLNHFTINDNSSPRGVNLLKFEYHSLIFPIRNAYGKIVSLMGRTILPEIEQKNLKISKYNYIKDFNKRHHLFGLLENKSSILQEDKVYIVEGQMDVIKATQNNFSNIVALGGTSLTPEQFSLITRYTNNIFLLLDNDEAGNKARNKIIKYFGNYANIQNVFLPNQYKDIDEYFSENLNPPILKDTNE